MSGAAVRLEQVTKEYPGGVHALRLVSVEVTAGDRVAVVGPSGSGKTTMLTVLGTLERPTSGCVEVAGRDVVGADDAELAGLRAHHIGFVFLHELASDGATLALITHDEEVADTFPRRIHLRDGEIVQDERA
jgi:putative ABC transport system ATP-binding protein